MAWLGLSFVVLTLLFNVPISLSTSTSDIFEAWCKEHGKTYPSDQEKLFRFKIFQENYEFVTRHNSQGNSPYKVSLNAFSDLTEEEFKSSHLGFHWNPSEDLGELNLWPVYENKSTDVEDYNIPSSVDWRTKGAVTPVKYQGKCGCCWAFATTGAIEGINKIVTGTLTSLSEQQLLDCDTSHNKGCKGGNMIYAYQYVIKNGGLTTEKNYPFRAVPGKCDKTKAHQRAVSINNYVKIRPYDEKSLLKAVAAQPVSVGLCGSEKAFKSYSKGIFVGPCSTCLDHAVLIVGYGTTKELVDYWIIKNSWGTTWGVNGYMYMLRNSGSKLGICGINKLASYPVKTRSNPSPNPSVGPNQSLIEEI